jgi:four helix bundle protein
MPTSFEDLRVLEEAGELSDQIWDEINKWKPFDRDVVGKQLARSVDSIGANVAEAFGRYHYGEKIRFLYYARGSIFESKYWINRAKSRSLVEEESAVEYREQLSKIVRQLNSFISSLKKQKGSEKKIKEGIEGYTDEWIRE